MTPTRADRVPLPRDAWYVGAAASRLTDAPLAVTLFDMPIVLFRDGDGRAAALHDRCPHRGVALSIGTVGLGTIACAYHGWRFGGDGRCKHIPSIAGDRDQPGGIAVRHFPAIEQQGHIWLWMGDGAPIGTPRPIDDFAAHRWLQGKIELGCEAIMPIENNLDLCHAAFTHPGLHPQYFRVQATGFHDRQYPMTMTGQGMTVGIGRGELRFDLPDRVTVCHAGAKPFRMVFHHVPGAPGRCTQHWLLAIGPADDDAPSPIWSDDEPELLAQDRRVMESAQARYDAEGDAFERSVEADATTLRARRMIELARNGEWEARRATLTDRVIMARS